jgi:hypothetical protein
VLRQLSRLVVPIVFDSFLKNIKLKNGFVMTILELETMNSQMRQLRVQSEALIAYIDEEKKKDAP